MVVRCMNTEKGVSATTLRAHRSLPAKGTEQHSYSLLLMPHPATARAAYRDRGAFMAMVEYRSLARKTVYPALPGTASSGHITLRHALHAYIHASSHITLSCFEHFLNPPLLVTDALGSPSLVSRAPSTAPPTLVRCLFYLCL